MIPKIHVKAALLIVFFVAIICVKGKKLHNKSNTVPKARFSKLHQRRQLRIQSSLQHRGLAERLVFQRIIFHQSPKTTKSFFPKHLPELKNNGF